MTFNNNNEGASIASTRAGSENSHASHTNSVHPAGNDLARCHFNDSSVRLPLSMRAGFVSSENIASEFVPTLERDVVASVLLACE